ncbi:MAG: polyprenyl synthetase family protein [Endomicrobium sp.]|jgi:geranylgeranyl diphosphate synthase type II|nr:polyprenyl synthetase family protein [Endomicrobium sp.]
MLYNNLQKYLDKQIIYINTALKTFLPKGKSIIAQSMRYSVLAGGKRLRPILVLLASNLFGLRSDNVIQAACAVEYLHTYSLVHDDLPAIDNDTLRRGKLANHKKFGEAIAILCGDALLTDAFNLLTKVKSSKSNIVHAIKILSEYSGYKAMIAGQVDDIRYNNCKDHKPILKKKLQFIQRNKTSSLIIASLKIGAILAGADAKSIKALEVYGVYAGMIFQTIDDILDLYANKQILGKLGSDIYNNRLTVLSLYNKQEIDNNINKYMIKAKKAISYFGAKADIFIQIIDYIKNRQY